jgi:hypothetical protein
LESSKNGGLAYIKYNIVSPNNIILFINIDKFEPNPILVNINKLKSYQYLDKAPRGLEATIERGREHKEDSQENFQDVFIEN